MGVDRGPELVAVLGVFLGLAWLVVCLRIYVKLFLTKHWGGDDCVLLMSLAFFTAYASCSLSGIEYGTGRHVDDIPPQDAPKALYYWFLCELFYTISTVLVRLSVAIFLLKICISPAHRFIIYGTMTSIILFSIAFFFLILFQCHPVSFFWNQSSGMHGSCINERIVPHASIAHSAISATCDWILGLLPVNLVLHLQINKRTKGSLSIVLALGILAGVAALIRIPYIRVLSISDDFLFKTLDVAIWSTIEAGLGIIAFAATALRPLFRTFYALPHQTHSHENISPFSCSNRSDQTSRLQSYVTEHFRKDSSATATSTIHYGSPQSPSQPFTGAQRQNSIQLRSDISAPQGEVTITSAGTARHGHHIPFSSSKHQRGFTGLGDLDTEWSADDGIQVERTVEVRAGSMSAGGNAGGNAGDREPESFSSLFSSTWTQRGVLGSVSERGRGSLEAARGGSV
ncbi:hypothetical protein BP5796_10505 [Coleophoma crateriformis]|uniref:Rhodopsin domain-containing protein n=1 Tax=Coleophoma crateriformis TaxID=565419 RepID=A0A3D8QQA8_9HELO|nr:hypothetical protein BP5796_10505 [Coleophoma crateriformis]